ncbi:hypothetical protein SRABI96_04356 [Peribacillus sp. Bi96]|nr:hypothetical protein SRABI96_04356 [Peribacillus sp. Bi96]
MMMETQDLLHKDLLRLSCLLNQISFDLHTKSHCKISAHRSKYITVAFLSFMDCNHFLICLAG